MPFWTHSDGIIDPAKILTSMSYLPIALYAESLRVNSALVSALTSRAALPLPVTGCVKDLGRLWHISLSDVLSDFNTQPSFVASLRHGNTFPLANKAILHRASIIGRRCTPDTSDDVFRPITVHLTYITPLSARKSQFSPTILRNCVVVLELVILLGVSIIIFLLGVFVGALLVFCLALNICLLYLLQQLTTPKFANETAVIQDTKIKTNNGAALDVHVVVENWNSSEIDVLLGYSSQLHALTNIPIRIKGWRLVIWIARALAIVLLLQAAALASLVGSRDVQVWGSLIWLSCYLLLLVPPRILNSINPDMLIEGQPAQGTRLKPLTFKGRKAALAFIETLPITTRKSSRWDWAEGFMPRNTRREQWESDIQGAGLDNEVNDVENGTVMSREIERSLEEIRAARSKTEFQTATLNYKKSVGLDNSN